jgi:hypothetical protein
MLGAGRCDKDKKPSYCGKECQKADWLNHKAFCKPGMPCSVIDKEGSQALVPAGPTDGSLGIRLPFEDKARTLSSRTMNAIDLREISNLMGTSDGFAGHDWSQINSISIDVRELNGTPVTLARSPVPSVNVETTR